MEKQKSLSIKQFFAEIKKALKPNYSSALGTLIGLFVISAAIILGLGLVGYMLLRQLMMQYYMMMYGMSTMSSMITGIGALILVLVLYVLVVFVIYFFQTAIEFNFQDVIRDPSRKIKLGAIFSQFKRLKKGQLIRLSLWIVLFTTLWQLPVDILNGFFGSNQIVAAILRAIGLVIGIWKGVEYSQGLLLYREKQPDFVGQSLRHSLTASRRFMGGRKINYIVLMVAGALPVIVWGLVWTAILYFGTNYGSFAMPTFVIYLLVIIMILGICAYLPVLLMMEPVFYESHKEHLDVDEQFRNTLLPHEKLVDPIVPVKHVTPTDEHATNAADQKSADHATDQQTTDDDKQ